MGANKEKDNALPRLAARSGVILYFYFVVGKNK